MIRRNWRKAAVASRNVLRSNFPVVNAEWPRRTGARTDSTISQSSEEWTRATISRKAFEPASIAARCSGLGSVNAGLAIHRDEALFLSKRLKFFFHLCLVHDERLE